MVKRPRRKPSETPRTLTKKQAQVLKERERVNAVLFEEHKGEIKGIIKTLKKRVLETYHVREAISAVAALPREMDLGKHEGYEKAVKRAFATCLKGKDLKNAIQIIKKLGQGIDFSEIYF